MLLKYTTALWGPDWGMETPKGWKSHRWEEQGSSQILLRACPELCTFCSVQAKLTPIYSTAAASPPRNAADKCQIPKAAFHSSWSKGTEVIRMKIFRGFPGRTCGNSGESISSSDQAAPAFPGLLLPLDTGWDQFPSLRIWEILPAFWLMLFDQAHEKQGCSQIPQLPIIIILQFKARWVSVWFFQF